MADAFVVLPNLPATTGQSTPPSSFDEQAFITHWKRDVERAASVAAVSAGLDRDEAQDFAQEAHIRLLAMIRAGRLRPESYVRAVITNAVRSARRTSFRRISRCVPLERPRAADEQEEASGEATIDDFAAPTEADPSHLAAVGFFVAGIPERLRHIYNLLYVCGFTQEEAARRLGLTRQRITQLHAELLRRGREHFQCVPMLS